MTGNPRGESCEVSSNIGVAGAKILKAIGRLTTLRPRAGFHRKQISRALSSVQLAQRLAHIENKLAVSLTS
jgi:hypothetical protein